HRFASSFSSSSGAALSDPRGRVCRGRGTHATKQRSFVGIVSGPGPQGAVRAVRHGLRSGAWHPPRRPRLSNLAIVPETGGPTPVRVRPVKAVKLEAGHP